MSTLALPHDSDGLPDTLRLRRALPVLLLLGVAAVLVVLGLRRGDVAAPHADVTQLPATLGTWQMAASEQTDAKNWAIPPDQLSGLSLDSYTQRVYRDALSGREVVLLLEYRRLGRGAFNHRPEQCYPNSGFTLTGAQTVPIDYGGQRASAVSMVADYHGSQGVSHQVLLYWFASGRHSESRFWKQQVEMALGRLQPEKNGWAFIRVVSEVTRGDEAGALAAEQDFVRQASPEIIRVISGTANH